MAPARCKSNGVHNRFIAALLDIARRVEQALHADSSIHTDLLTNVRTTLHRSETSTTVFVDIATAKHLDRLGCSIWNAASRIEHSSSHAVDLTSVALLHAFATKLLGTASLCTVNDQHKSEQHVRLLKVSLKAGQMLLQAHETDLALPVLETCSELLSKSQIATIDTELHQRVTTSYNLLRIQHAKDIGNNDLAEHFMRALLVDELPKYPTLCERAAELFYECGRSLADTDPALAKTWLQRSLATLEATQDDLSTKQTQQLKLSVLSSLVQVLLTQEQSANEAWDLISVSATSHEMVYPRLCMLQIDVLLAMQPLRRDLIGEVLLRMTTLSMTDSNFALISKVIYKLKAHDIECAMHLVRRIITTIMQDMSNEAAGKQLETCIVTFIHMLTTEYSRQDVSAQVSMARQLLDSVHETLHGPVSAAAAHAIQTLIWHHIAELEATAASTWMSILQHASLDSCSNGNRTRIERKAMCICLEIGDPDAARQVYFNMSSATQEQPISRYLAFKTALCANDSSWASQCLRSIAVNRTHEPSLLYACVVEAQQSECRPMVVETLQALVESSTPTRVEPVLLRCLGRLLLAEIDGQNSPLSESVTSFINILELFVTAITTREERIAKGECLWWSKTAFNLGMKVLDNADSACLSRLLTLCATVMAEMRADDAATQHEIVRKIMACHFAAVSKLLPAARHAQTDHAARLELYKELQRHISKYMEASKDSSLEEDWSLRTARLHRYNLEAIVRLRQWHELHDAISACLIGDNGDQWDKLADLALIVHQEMASMTDVVDRQHSPDVLELLQKSVNQLWKQERDILIIARWIRIMFTIDHDNRPASSGQAMFKLLDQAAVLASRGAQGLTDRYPDEELQWLASTAFNQGVDRYVCGDDTMAWQFFDAALELARHANDGGSLYDCLTIKRGEAVKNMSRE